MHGTDSVSQAAMVRSPHAGGWKRRARVSLAAPFDR